MFGDKNNRILALSALTEYLSIVLVKNSNGIASEERVSSFNNLKAIRSNRLRTLRQWGKHVNMTQHKQYSGHDESCSTHKGNIYTHKNFRIVAVGGF